MRLKLVKLVGFCEDGNEPLGSLKCGSFFYLAEERLVAREGLSSMELITYFFVCLVGWLVGWLDIWLYCWLFGWLDVWLVGWLVD
jgi:hypothetical protein